MFGGGGFFDSGGSIWDKDMGFLSAETGVDEILHRVRNAQLSSSSSSSSSAEEESQPDCFLEELLDEDDLLTEVKSANNELIQFLSRKANVISLIEYVTLPLKTNREKLQAKFGQPKGESSVTYEDADYDRMLQKFPYVSCEVLCCDVSAIMTLILEDEELLRLFFQILNQPSPLDPRLAGYFHKVLVFLVQRNPEAILSYATDSPDDILAKMLHHIDSYSISISFVLLLTEADHGASLDEEDADDDNTTINRTNQRIGNPNDVFTLRRSPSSISLFRRVRDVWSGGFGTASQVLNALVSSNNSDSHANAADLLSDMFHRAAHYRSSSQYSDWGLEVTEKLLNVALKTFPIHEENSGSASAAALRVLIQVVLANSHDHWIEEFSSSPSNQIEHASQPEIEAILRSLPDLCRCLKESSQGFSAPQTGENLLRTQWGKSIAPLGIRRLLVIELIATLVQSRIPRALKAITECKEENIFGICLDLFMEFEWNNLLHAVVDRMIRMIILGSRIPLEAPPVGVQNRTFNNNNNSNSSNSNNAEAENLANERRNKEIQIAKASLLPAQQLLFGSKCALLDRIVKAYDIAEEAAASGKHGQKGYMGYVHHIANACESLIQEELADYCEKCNIQPGQDITSKLVVDSEKWPALSASQNHEAWEQVVANDLMEVNMIMQRPLGGVRPGMDSRTAIQRPPSASAEAMLLGLGTNKIHDFDFEPDFSQADIGSGGRFFDDIHKNGDDDDDDDNNNNNHNRNDLEEDDDNDRAENHQDEDIHKLNENRNDKTQDLVFSNHLRIAQQTSKNNKTTTTSNNINNNNDDDDDDDDDYPNFIDAEEDKPQAHSASDIMNDFQESSTSSSSSPPSSSSKDHWSEDVDLVAEISEENNWVANFDDAFGNSKS